MTAEQPEIESEQVLEAVRDRVRAEALAENNDELESLLLLSRGLRERREKLLKQLQGRADWPGPVAQLDFDLFRELELAEQNKEIPAAPEIERIAPLHFLHKAYRKIALKTQRQFNRATARLFRATLRNLLHVELNQLWLIAEARRADDFEQRLVSLEGKIAALQSGQPSISAIDSPNHTKHTT